MTEPASEPIVVARKPLIGTVVANIAAHGVGGLNIDGCRVGTGGQLKWERPRDMGYHGGSDAGPVTALENPAGRWPANVVLTHAATADGGDACADGCVPGCPVAELDAQSGELTSGTVQPHIGQSGRSGGIMGAIVARERPFTQGDTGGASRFFPTFRHQCPDDGKPLALMRWLVRLVTPPGGVCLDPFGGRTTIAAVLLEGFNVPATVIHGDAIETMRGMADASVDAVVTDPPYDLTSGTGKGFMGKTWDGTGIAFRPDVWLECLRVLKPGGHLLAFGGTRTYHRMVCAIEDAGFEIRDSITSFGGGDATGESLPARLTWVYGSGFP